MRPDGTPRTDYGLLDIELLKQSPVPWTEVQYANMGRAEYRLRTGKPSSFNGRQFLHQMVRAARAGYEREGGESPWDEDYDIKPGFLAVLAPGIATMFAPKAAPPVERPVPVPEPKLPGADWQPGPGDFASSDEEWVCDMVRARGDQGIRRLDLRDAALNERKMTEAAFTTTVNVLRNRKQIALKPGRANIIIPYKPHPGRPAGANVNRFRSEK